MKGNKEARATLLDHLNGLTTVISTALGKLKEDPTPDRSRKLIAQVDSLKTSVFSTVTHNGLYIDGVLEQGDHKHHYGGTHYDKHKSPRCTISWSFRPFRTVIGNVGQVGTNR